MTMMPRKSRPTWRPPPRESVLARALTFAPLAWLKLQFLCHAGPTEVGGFGLSHPDDPLYVEDVLVVRQRCGFASVAFDDDAVADLCDDMADAGVSPPRYLRLWLHTHPGASVEPSGLDEATFARAFGGCDWAVMAILGRTGQMSARLRFNVGPGAAVELGTKVDWSAWPGVIDARPSLAERAEAWQREYETRVLPEAIVAPGEPSHRPDAPPLVDSLFHPLPWGGLHEGF
jgi:proteasome lid subunit RPN8/RPN11